MSMPTSRSPAASNDALNATLRLLALLSRSAATIQWGDGSGGPDGPHYVAACPAVGSGERFRPTCVTGAVDWRAV